MRVLIDGYNLLFQSGLGGRNRGPGWIQRARDQLIKFIQDHMSEAWAKQTTLVFDKSQGVQSQLDFQSNRGIRVRFAIEHEEADDLIEEMIREHNSPKSLIVVSSDLRVRRQTLARRAQAVDSETFLRDLESGQFLDSVSGADSNQDQPLDDKTLSEDEVNYWLREFGDDEQ